MDLNWLFGHIFSNGGLIVLLLIIPFLWKEGKRRLAVKTFIAFITTYILIELIKYLIPTDRPFVALGMDVPLSLVQANDSFPSGHAGMAFVIATSVWLAKHRLGFAMLGVAVLVGIGRVLLWVHFPIDVIVGGVIGAAIAFVLSELFHTRKRRLRNGPGIHR